MSKAGISQPTDGGWEVGLKQEEWHMVEFIRGTTIILMGLTVLGAGLIVVVYG
ncbi:MAG: hypothetical protein WC807_12730 [Hyphomicrobium sp.]|jgi:hypothetical protein